jgi:hypothetical protein
VLVIIGVVAGYAAGRGSSATAEVIPPGVGSGTPTAQALTSPIVISSWGFQLKVSSPT